MEERIPKELIDVQHQRVDLKARLYRGLSQATKPTERLLFVWEILKEDLAIRVGKELVSTWIEPLHPEASPPSTIMVSLPNVLFYQAINDYFLDPIEASKIELGIDDIAFKFEFGPLKSECVVPVEEVELPLPSQDLSAPVASESPQKMQSGERERVAFSQSLGAASNLNPNYLFDTFVKGPSNQFAMTTCQAVAAKPGTSYNPLFIYGSTGLGKTHLMHAIGNAVLKANPQAIVAYVTSERFMHEMIYCLRHNRMWDFRQKYRMCDVILIDDIQFISGKRQTQEEFFHTFNTLHTAKKQIVITSDLFPQNIPEIEERLRNRFQWGLIADIQPPDMEHRIAILKKKAEQLNVKLPMDAADYIARLKKKDVRELEGALLRLIAYSSFHGQPIDLDLVHRTFKDVTTDLPKRLTIESIQKAVADHYKIKVAELRSKRRQTSVAFPRQIAMYLARKLTEASFPDIGEKFGGKDHTTVMHNVRKIEVSMTSDIDLKATIDALERQIELQT